MSIIASNSSTVLKKYSLPFSSPGLGLRVVADMLKQYSSLWLASKLLTTVPLPAPEKPDKTINKPLLFIT